MISLISGEVRKRLGGALGWGIGMALFGLLMVFIFPQLAPEFENFNLDDVAFYEAFGDFSDLGSLKGFLSGYISGNFLMFLAAFAIIMGSAILVGEEDAGTLELLITAGVKRWQIVVAKVIALEVALFIVLLFLGVGFAAGYLLIEGQVDEGLTAQQMVLTALTMWPVTLVFATLTMWLGTFLPSRRPTWIVATVLFIYAFLINNLAGQHELIESIQFLSPFYYYQDGLKTSIELGNVLILLAISAVFTLLTILSFNRRNVTVGAWPWAKLLARFSR